MSLAFLFEVITHLFNTSAKGSLLAKKLYCRMYTTENNPVLSCIWTSLNIRYDVWLPIIFGCRNMFIALPVVAIFPENSE